jgi:hypothetical protein
MSLYAATAPAPGSKPSPRRQPIVPPRKPIDIGTLRARLAATQPNSGAPASEWQGVSEERWKTVTFADIPAAAYDHVLQELLKGMLFETTVAAEQQITKAATAIARGGKSANSARGRVNFGDTEEPTPLSAGPSAALAGSTVANSALGGAPTMYTRLHQAYNSVMADFATTETERQQARTKLQDATSSTPDTTNASTPTPSEAVGAKSSFSATVGSLCDRRVKQYERMLQASREEVGDLAAQLEDLREAHENVHADLNRSYREYDKVQRQLLEAIDRERQREAEESDKARRKQALTERQDARWKTKAIGQIPAESGAEAAPGRDL